MIKHFLFLPFWPNVSILIFLGVCPTFINNLLCLLLFRYSVIFTQFMFQNILAYSYLVTRVKCQCLSICCWYEYKYWLCGHNPNDYCCVKTCEVSTNQRAALTTADQSQVSNYYVSVWGVSIVLTQGQDVVSQQTVS